MSVSQLKPFWFILPFQSLDSIGNANFFLMDTQDYAFFAYNSAFAAATATIVAGTLAERCQMTAYLMYSVLLSGWVWPVVVHSVWSYQGFLSAFSVDPLWGVGMVDFAGEALNGDMRGLRILITIYAAEVTNVLLSCFRKPKGSGVVHLCGG